VLEARALVKAYAAPGGAPIRALDGVTLRVPGGALAVVLGASGSGKSTLLNVLGLLEDADGGEVTLGGERVSALRRSAKSRARGRYIGFVFQSFLLLPSLTALDNVLLAARYAGRAGGDVRRRARDLLAQFGVLEREDHYPPQLSGGEQQRVAFCRAVLNDPPVLLADEPTGNLDDANGRVILEALRARARAGAAVVVVSHHAEAAAGADAVYRMREGRLESTTGGEEGNPARVPLPNNTGAAANMLDRIERIVAERKASPPPGSYVAGLLAKGEAAVCRKIGEEAVEVITAALGGEGDRRVVEEMADLWFHTLVLLGERSIPVREVLEELARRHAVRPPSGG